MKQVLLFLFLLPAVVVAEETPLPKPPFLAPIPPGTLWRMERQNGPAGDGTNGANGKGLAAGTVLSRESIKSAIVRRDIFQIAPSVVSERWMAGGYLLIGAQDPQNIIIFSEEITSRTDWLTALDFGELSWVGPDTLVGWEKPGESSVLVFEAVVPVRADGLASIALQTPVGNSSDASRIPTQRVRARVDAESKRPLTYFDGQNTYAYSFRPDQTMPALPEDYRLRLESYLKRKRSMY